MNAFTQTIEITRQSACLLLRHRMVLVILVVAVLESAGLLFLPRRVAHENTGDDLYGYFTYFGWIQLGLPFLALFFGVTAVHQDLEDRTSTYLFLRPVRRSVLLVGKWLASTLVAAGLLAVPVVLTWCAIALPARPWRAGLAPSFLSPATYLLGAVMTAPAYAAVGAFAGACFKRPLVLAMAFLVGWEVVVSNLPPRSGVRGLTIADPLRRWLIEHLPDAPHFVRTLTLDLGREAATLGSAPYVALARATLLALACALWVYTRREYDSRPRD